MKRYILALIIMATIHTLAVMAIHKKSDIEQLETIINEQPIALDCTTGMECFKLTGINY